MNRSRRAALRTLGIALSASLAGCLGTENGRASTTQLTSETKTPRKSEATTPGPVELDPDDSYSTDASWSLTVDDVAVRIAVVDTGTIHPDPVWAEDGQFVVADFTVEGRDAPDPANLNVTCRVDTGDALGWTYVDADGPRDESSQPIGFEVPSSPAPTAGAIVWAPDEGPEVRWTLSEATLANLARLPEFELKSFSVADAPGDEVDATLTVANVGDGDGVFLAEVGAGAMSDQPEVEIAVPAGETRTVTRRVLAGSPNGGPTRVVLRWRDTKIERTVEPSETTTATAQTQSGTDTTTTDATSTETDG